MVKFEGFSMSREKKPAICILTNDFPPAYGGLGVHVGELYRHLKRHYRLLVVIKANKRDDFRVLEGHKQTRFKDNEALLSYLESLDIKLLHNHTIEQSSFKKGIATRIKNELKIPAIYTCHSLLAHQLSILEKYNVLKDANCILQEEIMQNSDKIIMLSNASKKLLEKHYPRYSKKTVVIPNGVSKELFRKIKHKRKIKNISFAGRLTEEKGVLDLAKAFSNLLKKHDIRLHILGSDFSATKKIERKMRHDLEDVKRKVKFHKWKNRKQFNKALRKMDLMILPSYHETFPFVVLEAMAAGIPVICSKIQNLDELFIKTNLVYPILPKNAKSIEAAVKYCVNNVSEMNLMAKRAQERIKKEYLWNNIIKEYKKLYDHFPDKNQNPMISVIIPSYNRIKTLKKCINSLLNQKNIDDFEIIVVDDGSDTNPLPELEKKYSKHIRTHKLRLYRKKNGGTASARNAGLKKAKGSYITFLDDDDLALPNRLKDLTNYLEQTPDKDFVHAKAITVNIKGKRIKNSTVCKYFEKFWRTEKLNENTAKILQTNKNCVHTQTVMFRRKVYDLLKDKQGKLFNENLNLREDFDLWKKIAKRFNMGFLDKYVAKYSWHSANKTNSKIA